MRYELLIQPQVPGTPFDVARVGALFDARGASVRPDGRRFWKLEEGEVELRPLSNVGQQVAIELHVPLSDDEELIREALTKASKLANEAEVRVFDPQLGRPVSLGDVTAVAEQYRRTSRYASEMLGVSEAMPVGYELSENRRGFQPSSRFFFGVIGFFLLIYIVMNWMSDNLGGGLE